nr:hypothetical protein [Streptomyces canus]
MIPSPCQSDAAHASAGTFTCSATHSTAAAGTSPADSGNRVSTSKNFNSSANPSRVAPHVFRWRSSWDLLQGRSSANAVRAWGE